MLKVLMECILIENLVERIYRTLAERESSNPKYRQVWEKLADEESDHARALEMAKRLLRERVIVDTHLSEKQVGELLTRTKQFLQAVQEKPDLPHDRVVRSMIALENALMKVHANLAIEFKTPDLQKMFSSLGSGDENHVALLKGMLEI
ncbi:MAG: hypothetical protein C0616_06595 [Desulfuromonas sp.]|nr:MAG: hypothetical protein C0616_06595 [Desulfuromonas sp.]